MSATGLDVFDRTLQRTHIWLDDIMAKHGPDRKVAWHILGAVLRALRDRLPVELSAHLASQLPLLVRGTYYEGYRPSRQPEVIRSLDEFLEHVREGLEGTRPVNTVEAVETVFGVLTHRLDHGQARKVRDALPKEFRRLWLEVHDEED
jgi:uncharacterized protein (DUF2267 family)